MPLLEEINADHDHWLGSYGSLILMFWLSEVALSVCRGLPRVARGLAERQREHKVSVLSVSLPTAVAPSPESRKALAMLSRDTDECLARIAVVREGRGFVASSMQSIAAGIHLLAQGKTPHKAFSDVALATRWAAEPLPDFRGGRSRVEDVVEAVTRKHRFFVERA